MTNPTEKLELRSIKDFARVLRYVRKQMSEGHSDLMAIEMATSKFNLTASQASAVASAVAS